MVYIVNMKLLIVLTALFAAVAAKTLRSAHITTIEELEVGPESRIISGEPAAVGQFPYQVANKFKVGSETLFCGGSLICDSWVLTAAHCAKNAHHFTIYLGSVNQSQPIEPGRVVIETTEAHVHPRYNSFTLNNDIALINLKQKVQFNNRIQPIPLGTVYSPVGSSLTVSGWGKTSDASNQASPILNYVNLNSISNEECKKTYGPLTIVDSTICCKGRPEHSTCNGDSGGPLIEYQNGNRVQVGVVSFVSKAGCASGKPSGYVRVSAYQDWIKKTINGSCQLANYF